MALALQPQVSVDEAVDALASMAGVTPAVPIAARRALTSLQTANDYRPSQLTAVAVDTLSLAVDRLPAPSGPFDQQPDGDGRPARPGRE